MNRIRIATLLLVLFTVPLAGADNFYLQDGDTVVFYGDSITQDGYYGQFVEQYVLTRFPEREIRFHYAGVGGDRVSGGSAGNIDLRLERDLLYWKPTVVTIMLGMNDGGYQPFNEALFRTYEKGYRHILERLKSELPGVRITLIRTSPFDDITQPPQFEGGYDQVLTRYGELVAQLGEEFGALVVDFGSPVNQAIARVQSEDPALARLLVPDRVHPGAVGHVVMATALLRAWNAPTTVSDVEIDASGLRISQAVNSHVDQLAQTSTGFRWQQRDASLPLPVDYSNGEIAFAEMAGAGIEALDQQRLSVTGLPAGDWTLKIDRRSIATFTAEQLAGGVNLARYQTPMSREQSRPVTWGTGGRKDMQTIRRQILGASNENAHWRSAAQSLDEIETRNWQTLRERVRPKTRVFELAK